MHVLLVLWQLYTVIMASQSDRQYGKINTQRRFESVRSASWKAGWPPQTHRHTNIWLIKTVCNQVKCKTEFAKATDEQVALMALRWSPFFFFVSAPAWAAAFVACGIRPGWYMTANCCLTHSIGHIGGTVTLTVGWKGEDGGGRCTDVRATLHTALLINSEQSV